eukprot:1756989-Rhodomonas_salina.1
MENDEAPNLILPNLYLGSVLARKDPRDLAQIDVKHVIDLSRQKNPEVSAAANCVRVRRQICLRLQHVLFPPCVPSVRVSCGCAVSRDRRRRSTPLGFHQRGAWCTLCNVSIGNGPY